MLEKILQKLKEQRLETSNVSDRTLEDIAKNLQAFITTDEQVEKIDLKVLIASIDGNISHYTAEQIKKQAQKQTKSKKDDTEKPNSEKQEDGEKSKKEDDVPAWARSIMEQNKLLAQKLDSLEADKTASAREIRLKKTLDGLPEYYTKPLLASFKRSAFETDEDFDAFLKEQATSKEQFIQSAKEQGLNTTFPSSSEVKKEEKTGETDVLADAHKVVAEYQEKQKKAN